jgi:hypothetical protein
MPDDRSIAESTSTWGVVNVESVELPDPTEDLRVPSSKLPWAICGFHHPITKLVIFTHPLIAFESGGLTISCTVLYPEQFDALRRTYDCEKSIIESLARCVKWDANGGKSGSAFLKTRGLFYMSVEACSWTDSLSRRSFHRQRTLSSGATDHGNVRTCVFRLYVVCGDR